MHNLAGQTPLTLETMGGLVATADADSLPKGASPRLNDVDFTVGGVETRPPLVNVFDLGVPAVGPNAPTLGINVLPGATPAGQATAPYTAPWINPQNVCAADGELATVDVSSTSGTPFAVVQSGTYGYFTQPTRFNPNRLFVPYEEAPGFPPNAAPALVPLGTGQISAQVSAVGFSLAGIPPSAILTGLAFQVGISPDLFLSQMVSIPNATVNQIGVYVEGAREQTQPLVFNASAGAFVGNPPTFSPVFQSAGLNVGGPGQLWGIPPETTVASVFKSPANGPAGGVVTLDFSQMNLERVPDANSDFAAFWVSNAQLTIYYDTPRTSDALLASNFGFNLPVTEAIQGVAVAITGGGGAGSLYTTGLKVQLSQNGQPWGTAKLIPLPSGSSDVTILGGKTDQWGITPQTGTSQAASISQWSTYQGVVTFFAANSFVPGDVVDVSGLTGGALLAPSLNQRGYVVLADNLTPSAFNCVCGVQGEFGPVSDSGTAVVEGSFGIVPGVVNRTDFGVMLTAVNITAQGTIGANIDAVTVTVYQAEEAVQFRYVKSYELEDGTAKTLALDSSGTLWMEDVNNAPGSLATRLEGITAGAYGQSTTLDDREFLCFSDLQQGIDQPRQLTPQGWIDRVTQVGPGASPTFQAAATLSALGSVTGYSIASNVCTLQVANSFAVNQEVTVAGMTSATFLNGNVYSVVAANASSVQIVVAQADQAETADSGTVTSSYGYPIAASPNGLTQPAQKSDPFNPGHFQGLLWSAGPGTKNAGTTITVYYGNSFVHAPLDMDLVNAFNSGNPTYVYVSGAQFGTGTWQVTSVGLGVPPGGEYSRWYFTYTVPTSNYQYLGGNEPTGYYQRTQATMQLAATVPDLNVGDVVTISGAGSGWNGSWTIQEALNSGSYIITTSQLSQYGLATFGWELVAGVAPVTGQYIDITGVLGANGILNIAAGIVQSVTGTQNGTFTVDGYTAGVPSPQQQEDGQATTPGSLFVFDPGAVTLGTNNLPIFGNSGGGLLSTQAGSATTQKIGSGTRQGVVFFITRNGAFTQPSAPVTFTTPANSNYIYASQIPIGPPNTIARAVAFTEAGANGVPGAFFYYIPVDVTSTANNVITVSKSTVIQDNVTTSAKFTFVDAVLLSATEIDVQGADLFNQIELGNPAWSVAYRSRMFYGGCQAKVQNFTNLSFDGGYLPSPGGNVMPLGWQMGTGPAVGSTAAITGWQITGNVVVFSCVNSFVAGQSFYVTGLTTGTFLNGIPFTVNASGVTPGGGSSAVIYANYQHADVAEVAESGSATSSVAGSSVIPSPVFGNTYFIQNSSGTEQAITGLIYQAAYQDAYGVAILLPNTAYSVRVSCRTVGSQVVGNPEPYLRVELVSQANGTVTATYGAYVLALSAMTSSMTTYEGPFATTTTYAPSSLIAGFTPPATFGAPFAGWAVVPKDVQLRVYGWQFPNAANVEVDRIEIFPTMAPIDATTVYPSYVDNPEAVDTNNRLGLAQENTQAVMGGAVMFDTLYFLKTRSMYSVQDNDDEPGNWKIREVSKSVGAVGPNAFDSDAKEGWIATACRSGVYVFNGGQPYKVSPEIQPVWELVNWSAGQTIWVRNDIENRRLYVGVPMALPNWYIPNPVRAVLNPLTPNVVLVLNYVGLDSFDELVSSAQMHTTVAGNLTALDMRRKWTMWQVNAPYAAFVLRGGGSNLIAENTVNTRPLLLGNGEGNSLIYQLGTAQSGFDVNGLPIPALYTTYGFGGASDIEDYPSLGAGRKRFNYLQLGMDGNTLGDQVMGVRLLANTLAANAQHTWTVPGGFTLASPLQEDVERPVNVVGQRAFLEISINQPGNSGAPAGNCWFALSRIVLAAAADKWASIRGGVR